MPSTSYFERLGIHLPNKSKEELAMQWVLFEYDCWILFTTTLFCTRFSVAPLFSTTLISPFILLIQ